MNQSRSTSRVRLMKIAIVACIVLTAVSARPTLHGAAAGLAGLVGFLLVGIAALGRLWTSLFIAGSKDASLVRSGPYAAVRHPLYALSLLGMLGLGLATRSLVLLTTLVGIALLLHAHAMRIEDARLTSLHGDAARRYRRDVPAWFPRFAPRDLPERLEIQPRIAWKAVLDAASLLLAWAVLEAADLLQVAGLTPTWLRLP